MKRALILLPLFLTGCGAPSKLIGKWEAKPKNMPGTVTTEFNADKTHTNLLSLEIGGQKVLLTVKGTYEFDGKKVKMVGTSYTISDVPEALAKSLRPGLEKELNKPTVSGVEFINDDTFKLISGSGDPWEMKRVKS